MTPAALAAATGLSLEAVLEARAAPQTPLSLDEPAHSDESALATLVVDPTGSDPEAEAVAHERTSSVRRALAALPARQRRIVSAQWGLDDTPESGAGVAHALRLSPRRAQTIGRDALYALRRELGPVEMTP